MADARTADASERDASALRSLFDAQRDQRILVALAAEDAVVAGAVVSAALDAAVRPDRVRLSVAVPADRASDPSLERWSDDPRVVIDRVPVGAPRSEAGMALLRSAARRRFDGEPFVVFVDGPAEFTSDWDVQVIGALQSADAARPLIDLADPPDVRGVDDGALQGSTPVRVVRRQLVEIAAPGRLCADVPADECDHDGSRLALRAYTHGYDCFAAPVGILRARAADGTGAEAGEPQDATRVDDDRAAPAAVDGLGGRRTVEAFARLLAWTRAPGSANVVVDTGPGGSATF